MKDHQKRELINELRDVAIQFHGAQQLRERIAHLVLPALRLAESDEREACAKVCDALGHSVLAHVAGSKIRERSNV